MNRNLFILVLIFSATYIFGKDGKKEFDYITKTVSPNLVNDSCDVANVWYSDTLSENHIPNVLGQILKNHVKQLGEVSNLDNSCNKYKAVESIPSRIEPLLGDIAFSQRDPYNDKCPFFEGKRCVTGCVATAMAQLMAYYRYPQGMQGDKIEYTTSTYGIPVSWDCSSTTFDWDNLRHTYGKDSIPDYTESESVTNEQFMTISGLNRSIAPPQNIELSNLVSIREGVINGNIQLLLVDETGNFVRPIGESKDISALKYKSGWNKSRIYHTIPSDIADGEYRLYVGFRATGSHDWSLLRRAINKDDIYDSPREECYISIVKNGNRYLMEDEWFNCGYNETERNSVATLCAACGAATRMDYGTDGSSTDNDKMATGLAKYMGYDDCMYVVKSNQFAEEGFMEKIIQTELLDGRPVYCCGTLASGGSHAFVIDGYQIVNGVSYFHVNWGWNGQDNDYYLLDNMTTSDGKNYGFAYSLTLGIKPKDGVDIGYTFTARNISASFNDNKLTVLVDNLINNTIKDFRGDLSLYARDANGDDILLKSFPWEIWKAFAGYSEPFNWNVAIPSDIKPGNYQIVLKAKAKDSSIEKDVLIPSFPQVQIENYATAVDNIGIGDSGNQKVYDLFGRQFKSINKSSIYIIDGKKILRKQ